MPKHSDIKLFLLGSSFVSCLILGFLSSCVSYYSIIYESKRPVLPFAYENRDVSLIGLLTFNGICIMLSFFYSFYRIVTHQEVKGRIEKFKKWYIGVRFFEVIMIITNIIIFSEFIKTPNSFVIPGDQAKEMFWYGIAICIILLMEIIYNISYIFTAGKYYKYDTYKYDLKLYRNLYHKITLLYAYDKKKSEFVTNLKTLDENFYKLDSPIESYALSELHGLEHNINKSLRGKGENPYNPTNWIKKDEVHKRYYAQRDKDILDDAKGYF